MTTPVVLITGALTGIGRATALAFPREGAHLVVSGRREEEGEKLVAELRKLGAEAEFVRSDVRREAEIQSLVDKTVARFGRLDVAVNNVGTEGTPRPVPPPDFPNYDAGSEGSTSWHELLESRRNAAEHSRNGQNTERQF